MATILFGISALEHHCTPPGACDFAAEESLIHGENPCASAEGPRPSPRLPEATRANAPDFVRIIDRQFNGALIGVSKPFHIIDPRATRGRYTDFVIHSSNVKTGELIPIADGLYVTTPERTILDLCRDHSTGAIAALMCEMCGLYTTVPNTERLTDTLDALSSKREMSCSKTRRSDLSHSGAASTGSKPVRVPYVAAFLDANGMRCDFSSMKNAWTPCIGRNGKRTSLWKRPPLCTIDSLIACAENNRQAPGIQRFRKALRYVVEGSGSPAETICAILMGPNRRLGQEGLPPAQLNRRVRLDDMSASSLGQETCVVDILWTEGARIRPGCAVEVEGAAFHDDSKIDPSKLRGTNADSARRAALAHMGLEVVTIAWSQLENLEQWDTVVDLIYRKLGIKRTPLGVNCLMRREQLHHELMHAGIH